MMKNFCNGLFRSLLIIAFITSSILYPFTIVDAAANKEAKNIKELKEKLAALKQEKIDTENSKKLTQSELNTKKNQSYQAYQEKEQVAKDIVAAEEEIAASNQEIIRVTDQTNELLRLLQQINSENAYLNFLAEATSLSDFLQKMATIEQISKSNQDSVNTLKDLIKRNEELKVELANKQVELENKITEYANKIKTLNSQIEQFNELNEDINSQIKNQEAVIKYFQGICTSDTQSLSDCEKNGSLISAYGWLKPLTKGRITSSFGYRTNPITGATQSFHNAIDIGGNNEGTPVYASASGQVIAITRKSNCGGNILYIIHNVNGKKYTTQYAHLLSISSNLSVGTTVTAYTQIGTVGGGSQTSSYDKCSTGAHLHYGVADGHYLKDYSTWSTYLSKAINPPGYPAKGVWWYIR